MSGHAQQYDLLVIGGGPPGSPPVPWSPTPGSGVAVVDERVDARRPDLQAARPGLRGARPRAARPRLPARPRADRRRSSGAARSCSPRTSAVAIGGDEVVLRRGRTERARPSRRGASCSRPGAHDRPVAFPGWTLPGVITAGGAQALVKTQRILPGERDRVRRQRAARARLPGAAAGLRRERHARARGRPAAGPARPRAHGRRPRPATASCCATPRATARRCCARARRSATGGSSCAPRARAGSRPSCTPRVDADWRVVPGSEERIAADTLCVGYGFFPSVELLRLAGCELGYDESAGGPVVVRDDWMRTSVPGVFAAGDGTGVAGSYVAIAEGRLAALGDRARPRRAHGRPGRRSAHARSARRCGRKQAFAPRCAGCTRRPRHLRARRPRTPSSAAARRSRAAQLDAAVDATADINVVKGLTRAGMGLCQGRNCQRQIAAMIARRHGRPLRSVPFATAALPGPPGADRRGGRRRSRTTGSSRPMPDAERPAPSWPLARSMLAAAARRDRRAGRRRRPRRVRARLLPGRGGRRGRAGRARRAEPRGVRARTPAASTSRSRSTS